MAGTVNYASLENFREGFKDQLKFANRFMAQFIKTDKAGLNNQTSGDEFKYRIKRVNIPQVTIGEFEITRFGTSYKIPCDPTFDPLSMTFYNETGYELHDFLLKWKNKYAKFEGETYNTRGLIEVTNQLVVSNISYTGAAGSYYTFNGIWPSTVSEISLSTDSRDTPQEFSATFNYMYYIHTPVS